MPTPHSSVNYIEPNFSAAKGEFSGRTFSNWALKDYYERAPRLEDYSIMLNLEVEVCGRKNISKNETVTKNVLILSYTTNQSNGKSVVNFMGGTKIECNDADKSSINFLTTHYADMYVGDLINYGTTEMIGVKSVDIEYQKSCVPIINIKFTDVRGLSLFQPTELGRTNAYQGLGGINAENVAKTFFQCFFQVPMPKFTITIKGFYGKPVTYEVLCDKFETSFNSDTGDFDINTRFIGYSYSFLTDIVMDALIAAPYSDYGGREGNYNKYWFQEVNSGRFTIENKEKTNKDNMPTLYEIVSNIKSILKETKGEATVITDEEKTHAIEIDKLNSLKDLYSLWYSTLYNICCERYGKEYVYEFKDDGCFYRLLILTNRQTILQPDLSYAYENFSDEFKEINQNLNSAIDEYNQENHKFRKIESVSKDFSDFKRASLFNRLFINGENKIIFNGFSKENSLPETDVYSKVFRGVEYSGETASDEAEKHKNHVLGTIYNDGADQYIDCYAINVDYRFINNRIKALQADANRDEKEKEHERKIKALNKEMFKRLKWYPSVENFTRIMMAHLETLMKQLYDCVSNCEGRTASQLKVNPGENIDVPNEKKDPEIPPFPRVYRPVTGDDGITKNEDTWVGEFNNGIGFEEVNFINGLFNGAERVIALYRDSLKSEEERNRIIQTNSQDKPIIKHPLTSFDFYITKSPYGDSSEVSSDETGYALAGRIAIRMFSILGINYFRKELGGNFFGTSDAELVGKIEAENFYNTTKITNDKIITMIRNGVFDGDKMFSYITSGGSEMPWGDTPLFSKVSNGYWLNCYKVDKPNYSNNIYPIQDISFSKIQEAYNVLNQGDKITNSEGNISLWNIPNLVDDKMVNTSDDYGYGTTEILDNPNIIKEQLQDANTGADSGYTKIYETISSRCSFEKVEGYDNFVVVPKIYSISSKIVGVQGEIEKAIIEDDMAHAVINGEVYGYDSVNDGFSTQSVNANFSNCIISEVFGISKDKKNNYYIDRNIALSKQTIINPLIGKKVGKYILNEEESKLTLSLMGILLNTEEIGKYLNDSHTVTYLPKLAILQIGAIIYASGGIHSKLKANDLRNAASKYLPVGKMEDASYNAYSDSLFDYIEKLNKVAKHQYEKYYIDWIVANRSLASKLFDKNSECYLKTYEKNGTTFSNRNVLNQNDETIQKLTNELLRAVCIVRLSINHHSTEKTNDYVLSEGTIKSYFKGFIEKLCEKYNINYRNDENGNVIKTTDEPNRTTDDMKKELYRYMKQIYDKWIPMSPLSEWEIESFFPSESEEIGHKFYFIDSFYNDIGHKLLINPKVIAEKIEKLISSGDINVMLLGFMADMYSANRAMLMCIQNFADLRNEDSMNEMFTPLSYNSINWKGVNKYSSFVVVYPYQASKNLNIPNGEYTNDGFMLNDEFETPMAIRSKGNGQYKIPAFGVSYGKQYQSYFKKVNIDMKSPIATEQAIRAKHSILLKATSSHEKGVKSQDLYDIYASQSYTCSVEMMGCAWVQPLMYFVLLNVPMFRGSYLIMKVKHSIRPGSMTTTFTGCRMANVANTLIEDIFTDGDIEDIDTKYPEFENEKQLLADTDNDCPYKIFPLYEDKSTLTGSKKEKAIQLMNKLIGKGFNEIAAAGIAGNIQQETLPDFDHTSCSKDSDGYLAAGICGWNDHYGCLTDMFENNVTGYGQDYKRIFETNEDGIKKVKAKLSEPSFGIDYQIDFMVNTLDRVSPKLSISIMNNCTSPSSAAEKFMASYEKGVKGEREKNAEDIYETYMQHKSETKNVEEKTEKNEVDIKTLFFKAVNQSALVTPSIAVALEREDMPNDYIRITQANKNNEKLPNIFDMILNSEYYNYIQDIGWIYKEGGLQSNVPPTSIYCKVSQSPNMNSKGVWATQVGQSTGMKTSPEIPTGEGQNNGMLLKPLAKRRAAVGNDDNFKKEVPQLKDLSGLDKYKPQDCNTLVTTRNGSGTDGGSSGSLEGYNGNVKPNTRLYTLLDVANNGKALDYMDSEKLGKNYKLMDARVSGSKAYKECCTSGPTTWYKRIGVKLTWWNAKGVATSEHVTTSKWFKGNGFNMVWHGHLSDAEKLPTSSFCPGDVATFHVYNSKGKATSHGVMWTGKDWRSDCIQRALSCYPGGKDRDGNYSVCIWRMPSLVSEGLGINNTPDLT